MLFAHSENISFLILNIFILNHILIFFLDVFKKLFFRIHFTLKSFLFYKWRIKCWSESCLRFFHAHQIYLFSQIKYIHLFIAHLVFVHIVIFNIKTVIFWKYFVKIFLYKKFSIFLLNVDGFRVDGAAWS